MDSRFRAAALGARKRATLPKNAAVAIAEHGNGENKRQNLFLSIA